MTKRKPSVAAIPEPSPLDNPVEAAATLTDSQKQLQAWERAVRLFTQTRYVEACAVFRDVAAGPAAHIADKARSYIQICERKTARPEHHLHTVEDHFNYGVERLNAGDTIQARLHFGQALAIQPDADHILYTLALCCGMSGDGIGACENLKRAIHLDPRNRILARQDPEFFPLFAQFPALRALLASGGF
jgi:tetratricopeptide (TPR) repeat protein